MFPRHHHFVVLVVDKQHFTFPDLIHFSCDHLSYALLVLRVQGVFFHVKDATSKVLTEGQHVAATKALELDFLGQLFADFKVVFHFQGFDQGDFHVFVFHCAVLNDFTVPPNFEVAFFRVDDDVKILIGPVLLDDHVSEDLFQNRHQSFFVDVLEFLEFSKRFQQVQLHVDSDCGAQARGLLNEMITFVQCTSP